MPDGAEASELDEDSESSESSSPDSSVVVAFASDEVESGLADAVGAAVEKTPENDSVTPQMSSVSKSSGIGTPWASQPRNWRCVESTFR